MAACLTVSSIGVAAQANQRTDLRAALKQVYELSTIEVQAKAVEGRVARQGVHLRLEADGVSAKPFRVTQASTKSLRFHTMDYARVSVASGQLVTIEPGELKLRKGTDVVVLDIKVQADTVRLFTHTSAPVSFIGSRSVYGCTEFVFRFDHTLVGPTDAVPVQQAIERWLSPTDEKRMCAPANPRLCLEP